jgi:hypothetical protein
VKAMLVHHILDYAEQFVRDVRYSTCGNSWPKSFIAKLFQNLKSDTKSLLKVDPLILVKETGFSYFLEREPKSDEVTQLQEVVKFIRNYLHVLKKCILNRVDSILLDMRKERFPLRFQKLLTEF